MKDIEIVVFNDKSWVRFSDYEKLEEKLDKECNELLHFYQDKILNLEKENQQLKQKFEKAKDIIKNLIDTLEVIDGEQTRELQEVKEAELILKGE